MRRINLYLIVFSLILYSSVFGQSDINVVVYVHDHYTEAPLDSALVKVFRYGAVVDSSYTCIEGRTQLTITASSVDRMQSGIPNTFYVSENYPNPFRNDTRVDFSIAESQTVRADVYNIIGQRVLSEELTLSAGYYTMNLSLPHLSTGIYFLRFRGKEQQAIKLMKVGDDVHYDTRLLSRGNIQVTARSSGSLPLQKIIEGNGEFTIQVEKDRYELWSVTKQIESDTEINAQMVLLDEYLLTDIDGNVYQTVKIGDQWWMAENLRVTRYRNGDAIPTGLSNDEWQNTTSGAYAIYPHGSVDGINSDAEMVAAYGKLYNWYAVDDDRGLCPEGWHVPSDDDWTLLVTYLGGSRLAGGKMKSTRTEPDPHPRWRSPNTGATNESGFSGLPGGYRNLGGNYHEHFGLLGEWWSSTENDYGSAWGRYLHSTLGYVYRDYGYKQDGFSVRCLRDDSDDTEVVDVLNPATGKIWMDRNLGASRAATSSTDEQAYGDLYQWGRATDGHQLRTSGTTSTLSSSDTPGHGNFILAPDSPWDWRSPQNDNLWRGVNRTNNPCPSGYRLPTEAEWEAERQSWSSNNAAGAFASPLKLPVAGYRRYITGSLFNVGSNGLYSSSSVDGSFSRFLLFSSTGARLISYSRASGYSVRCLKDNTSD